MTDTRATTQDFPVVWPEAGDEKLFWTHDRMHWPDPLPTLIFEFLPEEGFNHAFAHYGVPVRFLGRRLNTYLYNHMGPRPDVSHEQAEAMGKEAEKRIGDAMARLGDLWENEWLPEIKAHQAFWDTCDRRGASMPALLDHLDDTVRRLERLWQLHFLIVMPSYLPVSLLDDLYHDVFGKEGAFDAYRLLQGYENKTVEGGRELWRLSRRALAVPTVRRVLEEQAADQVVAALEASAEGRGFLGELRAFLDVHGQRGRTFATLTDVSWIEDPTPAIKTLKDLVGQPDKDFDAERAALVAERDQAVAKTRERLAGYPQQVREQFEFLLAAGSKGIVLSEDHNFWIDYSSTYKARRVFLEFGRRFAEAGVLEAATDVVHLKLDEIKVTAAALPTIDQRDVIAARKAEMARWAQVSPPPVLGTPPPGAPPQDAMGRFMGKFFGAPPPPPTEPGLINGAAGSPGRVRGVARVVRSLDEASKLHRGEILVAETTAPPWTPLFATAAAVVTDTGGILSHCAVVAREYGIPAVVGTGRGTTAIADGALVEVDGDAGTVRLLD